MKHLFLSPHNDDLALFCSFKIQALAPNVLPLIVYESAVQGVGTHHTRMAEDIAAFKELTPNFPVKPEFMRGLPDIGTYSDDYIRERIVAVLIDLEVDRIESIWAPAVYEHGHIQHNQIGRVAALLGSSGPKVFYYHTYTRTWDGKLDPRHRDSSNDIGMFKEILPVKWEHITRKLRALACYTSQIEGDVGCWPHFLRDQREWMRP